MKFVNPWMLVLVALVPVAGQTNGGEASVALEQGADLVLASVPDIPEGQADAALEPGIDGKLNAPGKARVQHCLF